MAPDMFKYLNDFPVGISQLLSPKLSALSFVLGSHNLALPTTVHK